MKTRRNWHLVALVCEVIGVIILFVFARPQPDFETDDVLAIGPSANAKQIVRQKNRYYVMSGIGLFFLLSGCGIQMRLVWTDNRM